MTISDLLGQLSQRAEQRRWQEGRLGKPTADGQYNFYSESNDRPGFIMVGLGAGSDTLFIEALNMGVPLIADLPVRAAKNSEGIWEVYPNGLKTQQYLGALAQVGMSAPHTHEIGGGNPDPVSPRRITIGLVHTTSPPSMLVQVSPFFYRVGGLEQYFAGGALDLTAYQPSTANMWAWVKVGLDPATNTLIGEMGTEYSVVTILTDEMLTDIEFAPNIPCGGVRVKESDTSIGEESRFSDCRIWITADNAGGATGLYLLLQPTSNTVINDAGSDIDIRIEGDTDANLFTLDAGLDLIAIGGAVVSGIKTAIYGIFGVKAGGSTAFARVGGRINVNTTAVGNVLVGEDDLITYSVPAATLSVNGDALEVRAAGVFAASLNNKRLRAYLGGSLLFDSGVLAITAATDWTLECIIIRTGATTQKATCTLSTSNATLAAYSDYTTPAETLANALTLKLTGEAVTSDDIVQEFMVTDWIPNA